MNDWSRCVVGAGRLSGVELARFLKLQNEVLEYATQHFRVDGDLNL